MVKMHENESKNLNSLSPILPFLHWYTHRRFYVLSQCNLFIGSVYGICCVLLVLLWPIQRYMSEESFWYLYSLLFYYILIFFLSFTFFFHFSSFFRSYLSSFPVFSSEGGLFEWFSFYLPTDKKHFIYSTVHHEIIQIVSANYYYILERDSFCTQTYTNVFLMWLQLFNSFQLMSMAIRKWFFAFWIAHKSRMYIRGHFQHHFMAIFDLIIWHTYTTYAHVFLHSQTCIVGCGPFLSSVHRYIN